MNVDIHIHTLPESLLDALMHDPGLSSAVQVDRNEQGQGWIGFGTSGYGQKLPIGKAWFDIPTVVRDIDRMQLDVAALSILPSLTFDWVSPEIADAACRAINDSLAEMVKAQPDRFVGLANVALSDPARATAELERAVKQLGLRGVQIPSHVQGKNFDEPEFFPFFAKCQELDVPIFIHPYFVPATFPTGTARLARYHSRNYIGNPVETTIAAASLIFGGVLDRLPNLKVVLAHGGGVLPFLIGRFDHGFGVRDESKLHVKRRPSEYFESLYFDTITHSHDVLAFLVNFAGAERVVIGTDYPADMANSEPVARVQALPISRADRRRILGGNLQRLLKLG